MLDTPLNREMSHYTQLSNLLIRSPSFLCFLLLWAINDHYLKYVYPSFLTGKISDITSLACTPILMWVFEIYFIKAVFRIIKPQFVYQSMVRTISHWAYLLMILNALAMAALMIGININSTWAYFYKHGLAWAQWPFWSLWYKVKWNFSPPFPQIKLTMDPSDVWTVPATLFSLVLLRAKLKELNSKLKDNV